MAEAEIWCSQQAVRVTVWIADNEDNSVLSEDLYEAFRPRISLKTVQNCPSVR